MNEMINILELRSSRETSLIERKRERIRNIVVWLLRS